MLQDILGSEEIYLMDALDTPLRVNVTADDLSYGAQYEEPKKITLQMLVTDGELYAGDYIKGVDDSKRPRVHTNEFTKQFN